MTIVLTMTITSQRSLLPDLRGQVCLLADADDRVAQAIQQHLRDAGAEVIALHHDDRLPREPEPFRAGVDIVTARVDLADRREVADALTWALKRTGRIDLAILTSKHGGLILVALAARQLGITGHFQPDRVPLLVYLARPSEQAFTRLETALADGCVFADPIDVVVVDAWPDTPRSTVSAVAQLLAADRCASGAISRFDPLLSGQLTR